MKNTHSIVIAALVMAGLGFGFRAHAATNRPVVVGSYDTAGNAQDVAVVGNTAFVADATGGMLMLDIEDPASPVLAKSFPTSGNVTKVSAYRTSSMVVIDGSILGFLSTSVNPIYRQATFGSYSPTSYYNLFVTAVQQVSTYTYVGVNADHDPASTGIRILNSSDPAAPVQVGAYTTSWPSDLEVVGNYLYATIPLNKQLLILDIANPASPTLVGSLTQDGSYPLALSVSGTTVFINDWLLGVQAIDVSNPVAPTLLTTVSGGTSDNIIAHGNLVFASTNDAKIMVYDASVRGALTHIHTIELTGTLAGGMAFHDQYLVVANGNKGVVLVDTTGLGNPVLSYLKVHTDDRIDLRTDTGLKVVQPFGKKYRSDVLAAKVDFGAVLGPLFILVPGGKTAAGKIMVYDKNFKFLQQLQPFAKAVKGGFNANIGVETWGIEGAPPQRVYLAVAAKQKGTQVRLYRVTATGLTPAGVLTAASNRQAGEVLVQFIEVGGKTQRLVSMVKGDKSTLRVLTFDESKNAWARDTFVTPPLVKYQNGRFFYQSSG